MLLRNRGIPGHSSRSTVHDVHQSLPAPKLHPHIYSEGPRTLSISLFFLSIAIFPYLALAAPPGSTANSTDSTANSAIGTSSDVWATLVANIAPLLILVGEKHVKAYFKIINTRTQCLLYAVGPIGLITAVTTVVRITGPRVLKRLIGRQYESRREVLVDLTSVSAGPVTFEIRHDLLEQTIEPAEETCAMFYAYARKEGNLGELSAWTRETRSQLGTPTHKNERDDSYVSEFKLNILGLTDVRKWKETLLDPLPAWNTYVGTFKVKMDEDPSARDTMMLIRGILKDALSEPPAAGTNYNISRLVKTLEGVPESVLSRAHERVTGFVQIQAGWAEISPTITAAHSDNDSSPLIQPARIIIILLCLSIYVGIIIMNWRFQRDYQNTALVAAGITISTVGAYYTAQLVNTQSVERVIDLGSLCNNVPAGGCGYYSPSGSWGIMDSCPKKLISSTPIESTGRRRRQRQLPTYLWGGYTRAKNTRRNTVFPAIITVAMTLGYVALYLGLRTSEWWASLSVLIVAAIASIARVLLVTDKRELSWLGQFHDRTHGQYEMVSEVAAEVHAQMGPWPWNLLELDPASFLHCPAPTLPVEPYQEGRWSLSTTDGNPRTLVQSAANDTGAHPFSHIAILQPAIISNQEYLFLVTKGSTPPTIKDGDCYTLMAHPFISALVQGAILVVLELYRRSLVPAECCFKTHVSRAQWEVHHRYGIQNRLNNSSAVPVGTDLDTTILFSDILTKEGIWRQALELHLTPMIKSDSKRGLRDNMGFDSSVFHLRPWLELAEVLRKVPNTTPPVPVPLATNSPTRSPGNATPPNTSPPSITPLDTSPSSSGNTAPPPPPPRMKSPTAVQVSMDHSYYTTLTGTLTATESSLAASEWSEQYNTLPRGKGSFRDYAWMAGKILYVLLSKQSDAQGMWEKIMENLPKLRADAIASGKYPPTDPTEFLRPEEATAIVDCMERIFLALPAAGSISHTITRDASNSVETLNSSRRVGTLNTAYTE